jgi:ribonuclease HI
MITNNCAIIKKEKSKEFERILKKNAKNKKYWESNKEFIKTHRINSRDLEALYKNE